MADYSKWLKLLGPYRRQNIPGASRDEIVQFAKQLGYNVQFSPSGEMVAIPDNIPENEIQSFFGAWSQIRSTGDATESNRSLRFRSYVRMDAGESYGSIILDTYADEAFNITNTTDFSLKISMTDEEIAKKIEKVFVQNDILDNARTDLRSVCKFGDGVYVIVPKRGNALLKLDERPENILNGTKIADPLRPEDMTVLWMNSKDYELEGIFNRVFRMKITDDARERSLQNVHDIQDEFNPWEYSLFTIRDRDTFPYGRSVLEKSRVTYEQLAVVEQLLGITRANKLDRVAVKVPGLHGDPAGVLARLSQLKNSLKNVILSYNSWSAPGNSGDRVSRNVEMGLTEYLWIPENFDITKLPTSVDFGSVDDVDYFKEKFIDSTGLPKGYFTSDRTDTRPGTLRQQDIRFARSLIPVQEAYCRGLERLILLLGFYLGADINRFEVKVELQKSPYISSELVSMYDDVLGLIDRYIQIMQTINENFKPNRNDIEAIINAVGGPRDLFFGEDVVAQSQHRSGSNRALMEVVNSPSRPLVNTAPYRTLADVVRV